MPTLALPALQKQLAAGRPGRLHLFVGEDTRLIDQMIDQLEAMIEPADRPFVVERIYASESGGSPVDIAAAARSLPMLGDRRVVIVLRAERMLKPRRASRASTDVGDELDDGGEVADVGALEDYIADPVDTTTLVFVATQTDRTRRFTKRLYEKAQVTTFGGLAAAGPAGRGDARTTAAAWIRDELDRAGYRIEPAAVEVLVERAGTDISKLRGDVERLLLYVEGRHRVTRDDALATVSGDVVVQDDWAVVNAIAAGDAAAALRETARRFDRGDSPHQLLGQLRWWVANRLTAAPPRRVASAVDALLRTDLALKSSGGDERILLERLVVELSGR